MMTKAMSKAAIAHQIPGRVRLRIVDQRGNPAYFRKLADEFSHFSSVKKIRVNPVTGSLVLEFSGELEQLIQGAQSKGLFRVDGKGSEGNFPMSSQKADAVNLVSGREIGPMFMIGTALGAMTLFRSMRGPIFGPAITAFWYTVQAFRQSNYDMNTDVVYTDVT